MSIMNSINTNVGSMAALQNLNSVNGELSTVQSRVSTGLKVASAQDDGASFAIAQGLRSDVKGIGAVNEQISKAKGLVGTTITALTEVSNGLADVQSTVTKLADARVDGTEREQYQADLDSKLSELDSVVSNAEYNGINLIDGDSAAGDGADDAANDTVDVIIDAKGGTHTINGGGGDYFNIKSDIMDIQAEITTAGGELNADDAQSLIQGADNGGATAIANADVLTSMNSNVNDALNQFAADDRRLTGQQEFNTKLSDAIEEGLGATVDADLAKESARLQSLQIKQQLSTQTLGIANQSPQILLSLFGG